MKPVIGLDLSLTGTGVAVWMPGQEPAVTVIRTKPKGNSIAERSLRLSTINQGILEFAATCGLYGSDEADVVIEQPAYAQTQGAQHDRSGLWWIVVRGMLNSYSVTEIAPTSLKKWATGRGNCSKEEMIYKAAKEWPGVDAIDDNGVDALFLASMGRAHQDPDLAGFSVTAARRAVLKAVAWAS